MTRLALLALLGCAAVSPLPAQLEDELTVTGSNRVPLSLRSFAGSAGAAATERLRADLRDSGVITFSNRPDAFRVQGSADGSQALATLFNPAGQSVFDRRYDAGSLPASIHALSDDIVFALTGRPGFASSRIVFTARRGRSKEIFLCDYDGAGLRQLTRDGSIAVAPAISNDRRLLAFTSYRSGYPDIEILDLQSGARRRIISYPGTNGGAAFSPDNRSLALTMSFSGNSELYVTGSSGGRPRALTRTAAIESSPSWSPDGRELVYCASTGSLPQIYRMSSGGGTPRKLNLGFNYCTEPDWSPDGKRLVFTARAGGSMVMAVHEFPTGRTAQLRAGEDPAWGADSRHLIFTSGGALFRLDTETGASVRILPDMTGISEPSWSP
ncbi:MAG TPA: hypothetical protein VMN36_00820 [Verrucomicrobiales bacterium]|nr:hypothetical protein [Verrucomicrobiales bacterium]